MFSTQTGFPRSLHAVSGDASADDRGIAGVRIRGKRDLPTRDWLVRIVKYWDAIERVVRERPDGPWFYVINEGGLSEIPLDR